MNDQTFPIMFIAVIAIFILILVILIALILTRRPKQGVIDSKRLEAGGDITIKQTIHHSQRSNFFIYLTIALLAALVGMLSSVITETIKTVFQSQLNVTLLIVFIVAILFFLIVAAGIDSWREARLRQSAKKDVQSNVSTAISTDERRQREIAQLQENIAYHTQKIENLDKHTKIWRRHSAYKRSFHANELKLDTERLRQLGVHVRPKVNMADNRKIGFLGHFLDMLGWLSMFLILLTIGTFSSYMSVETGLTARIIQLSLPHTKSENPIGHEPTPIPRQTGSVIIIAGRDQENDALQENIHNVTDRVYRLFHEGAGYPHSHIHYMATNAYMNSDSANIQIDAEATIENLQDIILNRVLNQVNDQQPLTIYMMSHGLSAGFYLDEVNNERVYAVTLDSWLDELETLRPGLQINIIIDGCYAGSFVENPDETIAGENRVIIGSSSANELAWASREGALFSDYFLLGLQQRRSLKHAFQVAQGAVGTGSVRQNAWIDADGDSRPNETEDGDVAATRFLLPYVPHELASIIDDATLPDQIPTPYSTLIPTAIPTNITSENPIAHTLTPLPTPTPEQTGAVIIVAGRDKPNDDLQENTHNVTDNVYRLFHEDAGYPHSHIHYMATNAYINSDPDNIYVDAEATIENLQEMILKGVFNQIDDERPLTIYMMSYGLGAGFYLDEVNGERVNPIDLDSWLDELESLRPGVEINLIIDASYAGSFIANSDATVAGQNRVVIGSSSVDQFAWASFGSANFSDFFLLGLQQRRSLKDAFKSAQAAVSTGGVSQNAWIEGDGDGQPNEAEDGDVAATRFLLPHR